MFNSTPIISFLTKLNSLQKILANLPIVILIAPAIPFAVVFYILNRVANSIPVFNIIFPPTILPSIFLLFGFGLTRGKFLDRFAKAF